jgi:hypothetical protein
MTEDAGRYDAKRLRLNENPSKIVNSIEITALGLRQFRDRGRPSKDWLI